MANDRPSGHADSLSHLLWDAATRTQALAEKALADTPLTLSAIGLLDRMAGEPGITIAEIARRTPKTAQTISQVVARLEKLGFVERRLIDGRRIGLFVTDAGATALRDGVAAQDRFEAQLTEAIGAKQGAQLRRLLARVSASVASIDAPLPPR